MVFNSRICNKTSRNRHRLIGLFAVSLFLFTGLCTAGVAEVTEFGGLPAPSSLALEDLAGEKKILGDFRGSVVIVNFWATWCPPCLREFPALERLKREMVDRPLEILAVNAYESKAKVRRFRRLPENGIRVLLDNTGKETESWFVKVYPTSFIIDPEGRVVRMVVGEYDWDSAEAREWIDALSPAHSEN